MTNVNAQKPDERMSEYIVKRNRGTILRLIKYFGINKTKTFWSLFLAIILNVAIIMQPLIVMVIIDNYLAPGVFNTYALTGFAGIFLLMVITANGAGYAQNIVLRSLGQEILHKIRTDLFGHIQTMNMSFFDKNASGRILTRVTNDIESLQDLYSNVFIMVIRESLLIVGMITTMFILDPILALWCLISIPVVLVLMLICRYFVRRIFIQMKTVLSRIYGYLAENITGMKIIQIFNREKIKFDTFNEMNDEYFRLGRIDVLLNGLTAPLVTMISNLMIALLIAGFHGNVTAGYLYIGVLFAFTTYVRQLFDPIASLSEQHTTAQSAFISADRIFDILDNHDDAEDLTAGTELSDVKGSIEFQDVWFAYTEQNWILKGISFNIEQGKHAAFVGATGCGKSTIMSLISRFYDIQKGKILIDGKDVRELSLHSLRRNIAMVIQDVFLFTGDIRYNIRLNNHELKNKHIEEAAKIANCHDMILAFRDGYLHKVAERGSDFSLGQRQLISFARAVAVKPSILILDEATSNIDSDTEQALQSGLDNYSKDKTLLIIAHRISTIVNADVIFVMDKGVIIEEGNHTALMMHEDGVYKKLYTLSQS